MSQPPGLLILCIKGGLWETSSVLEHVCHWCIRVALKFEVTVRLELHL